jgi:hypothetical protein
MENNKPNKKKEETPQVLQVASNSVPSSVAGAIAGMIRER